jgi:hypothetical protein
MNSSLLGSLAPLLSSSTTQSFNNNNKNEPQHIRMNCVPLVLHILGILSDTNDAPSQVKSGNASFFCCSSFSNPPQNTQ